MSPRTIKEAEKRIEELELELNLEKNSRRSITQELHESGVLLKAVLNQLPVVICGMDTGGGIIFLNREFEKISGYGASELLASTDAAHYLFPDLQSKNNSTYSEREWNLTRRDGKERIISWSDIQECPIPGWEKWKVGLDITHLKQLERLRDDIDSIVRHDLKSPLNAIIGLSSLLQADKSITEKHKLLISNIESSGERMLGMLENSLALYNIESGGFKYQPDSINVSTILKETIKGLSSLAKSHRVSTSSFIDGADLSETTDCFIPGIHSLLQDILTNLIKNAIEASPAQEQVTIHITHEHSHLLIDIHNVGVIPECIRNRFFDRFVTSGKNNGTGLGTYGARLMVEAQKGTISFTTSENEGTHILLELPLVHKDDHT